MNSQRFKNPSVWRDSIIGVLISMLLHVLIWQAWQHIPHETKVTPSQVITVSLMPSAPAQTAPAQPTPVVPEPPPPPKPEPKKVEKPKQAKPKPVAKPTPLPEPPRETPVEAPAAQPNTTAAAAESRQTHEVAAATFTEARYSSASLHNPPTRYPRLALERGWEGLVRLKVEVLPNGTAGQILIIHSAGHELLDESALEHIKTLWHFEPARRGNQAIVSWVVVPIEFKIRDKE